MIEIHVKNGIEKELGEILWAWRTLYPAKYRFFKSALAEMRKVQKNPDGSWVDQKGRESRVAFRVPTELWLFIQHRIPGFGKDYRDVEVLLKVAKDFDTRWHMKTRRVWTSGKGKDEPEHSDTVAGSEDVLDYVLGEPA
ncbi:MAG: hypothetical protein JXA57_06585 [Armatimonadetes bacterium]|nr:hypothetical protein [Armatimonadota bacterium]